MHRSLLVLGMLVAGCAPVGPEFVRPDSPLNPAWLDEELAAFDTSPAELMAWWRVLDDPVLDELIRVAHRDNNNLRIAGLRVIEARAALNIATGNRYPQSQFATGEATAVGASESSANTAAGDLEFVQYGLGAGISWEADFWGRFRRGIEAADANLLASVSDYDEVLVLLTAQVADTYAVIRATEEQLRLARRSLVIQRRSYEIVDLLYRRGDSSELDALQARTLLLSTEASIPGLEATLRQGRHAMAALLGRAPADLTDILAAEGTVPVVPGTLSIGLPADLLRQRPDVRGAELRALAQNARVGVATANLYPSFSLSGFLGLAAADSTDTTRTGETGIGELFRAESITYSVGAGFVWPFLNYGRLRNNIRVEDARLQQALVAWRETVIQAAREVEDAVAAFESALAQDAILSETVGTAERSAELSLLRYQEGFADYQRVLDAQQALFTQQQRYAANRGNVVRALVGIYRSLGGGWQTGGQRRLIDEESRRQMQQRTDWGDVLEAESESNQN